MAIAMPSSVRSVFGEEAAEDFSRWIDEAISDRAVPRDEYREVLSRLDVVESPLNRLETSVDELRREMNSNTEDLRGEVHSSAASLRSEMNSRFNGLDARLDRIHDMTERYVRWSIGAIVAIGAILSALLAIAEFAV